MLHAPKLRDAPFRRAAAQKEFEQQLALLKKESEVEKRMADAMEQAKHRPPA